MNSRDDHGFPTTDTVVSVLLVGGLTLASVGPRGGAERPGARRLSPGVAEFDMNNESSDRLQSLDTLITAFTVAGVAVACAMVIVMSGI